MTNEGKINLNNSDSVLKRLETESFSEEVARLQMSESGTGEITITDENISNNAKLITDMFDEKILKLLQKAPFLQLSTGWSKLNIALEQKFQLHQKRH